MRVFAPDSIKSLMGRFGIPEDEAIENSMVSRALESAQTKIEGFNFDARKHVLEFDNVLDRQRRAVYERRLKILTGSLDEIELVMKEIAGENVDAQEILKRKEIELGREAFFGSARGIMLQTLDMLWVEHLESMEYLRGSVNLRAYGQRDPLTEYRKEGTRLYKDMEVMLAQRVFEVLEGVGAQTQTMPAPTPAVAEMSQGLTLGHEVGRNDPCPCGSGKKYKNCGLKNTEEHQRLMAGNK